MKPEDLRKGDYVYEKFENWDYHYIIKIGSGKSLKIAEYGDFFNNERNCDLGNQRSFIRKATKEEKRWLDACIKADRLMLRTFLIDNYQMY